MTTARGWYRLPLAQVVSFIATLLVLVAVTAAVVLIVPLEPISAGQLDSIEERAIAIGVTAELLRAILGEGRRGTPDRDRPPPVNTTVAELQQWSTRSVTDLDIRLGRLEAAILDDPARALELPLVRRDIESVRSQMKEGLEAVRLETARAYDLMKLLVSMMAAVSLSLVGMAAAGLFKSSRESGPTPPRTTDDGAAGRRSVSLPHTVPLDPNLAPNGRAPANGPPDEAAR